MTEPSPPSASPPPTSVSASSARHLFGRAIVALAILGSAAILAKAFVHYVDVKHRDGIEVAGSARSRITSDRAMWSAEVSTRGATLVDAYTILTGNITRVRAFLQEQGVPEEAITVRSAITREMHPYDSNGIELNETILGYGLTQQVEVTSSDIALVGRVSRDITQLIQEGINIASSDPEYIYTELGDVKIRLVGEATEDARQRAEQVATHAGGRLGRLVSARIGVVQVNAADETAVSWDGVYDRSTVEKDVMIVVRTVFELE